MDNQPVFYKDLGIIDYKSAWDYQEQLVRENQAIKAAARNSDFDPKTPLTKNYLLFCEHPPVYTLGKSGNMNNVLLSEQEMDEKEIEFFKTNRGGDITFHGLQQLVGYPIFDLEKFYTDIGKYLRSLEQVIINTISEFGLKGERSSGETGVWLDPGVMGRERKICAMGIRCSRWITMHGFALNVNTDLSYFEHIIPCGIQNKQVTSIEKELNQKVDFEEVKKILLKNFQSVFSTSIIFDFSPARQD